MSRGCAALLPRMSKNRMLLIDGCVQWCSVGPTPQFVLSMISTPLERQTRSSRVDSPGRGSSGPAASLGCEGCEMSTTISPPCGWPTWPPSVRLPMYA
jgi:hypothetical protein